MRNKLKLVGTHNIELFDSPPENQVDYLLSLRVSLDEIRTKPTQGEEQESIIYVMKVLHPESFMKIGESKTIKIAKGTTPSQQLRWALMDYFQRSGVEDTEENYEKEMQKITEHYNNKNL